MNYELFYESFIGCLNASIPERKELVDFISRALYIDKRAASRRLRGDYQFRIEEIFHLCYLLDISLDEIILKEQSKYNPLLPIYYPFDHLTDKQYSTIYQWLEKYKVASRQKGSYILITSNILPEIFCFQYESLIRLYKIKWAYFMGNRSVQKYINEKKILEAPRLEIIKEYIHTVFEFENLLVIWDANIIPSLIQDIEYFTNIGYLTSESRATIKKELFLLIDQLDRLCKSSNLPDNSRNFTFAISSIFLNKSYSLFKGEDFKVFVDSAFYTTYLVVKDSRIVESVEHIILSTLKSSVIISQSNEKERLKFIEQHRKLVEAI